eukprot:GILK01007381.1.p1 GENE.GILK01007381.1~~GILK01007381.1.p1  ORF type:complete len:799 (-),score=159.90 GILK01007381.1:73-2469(-)
MAAAASPPLVLWVSQQVSRLLGLDQSEDIAKHLLGIENDNELRSYTMDILGDSAEARAFIDSLLTRRKSFASPAVTSKQQDDKRSANQTSSGPGIQEDEKLKSKKKKKFVPVSDVAVTTQPGRRLCDCQARQHPLVTNCLSCGRIVCEQEGSGPCMFCANWVGAGAPAAVVTAGQESLRRAVAHKDKLLDFDRTAARRLQVIDDQSDWFDASENTWLSDEQRALAKKRAEEVELKKEVNRRTMRVTFDIAGRRVIQEPTDSDGIDLDIESELAKVSSNLESLHDHNVPSVSSHLTSQETVPKLSLGVSPSLGGKAQELYELIRSQHAVTGQTATLAGAKVSKSSIVTDVIKHRIQHDNPFDIIDELTQPDSDAVVAGPPFTSRWTDGQDGGVCLSMHQPWASLLVLGFKQAEGRSWHANHVGRLWIHAAAKVPEPEEIAQVESFYESYYRSVKNRPAFPVEYPTSCLLGCVDVTDCLSHEQYVKRFPNGEENHSNFVFVCSNPRKLVVPIRLGGQHKLWKLDNAILKGAQRALRPVDVRWHHNVDPVVSSKSTQAESTSSSLGIDLYPELIQELGRWSIKSDNMDESVRCKIMSEGRVNLAGALSSMEQQHLVDQLRPIVKTSVPSATSTATSGSLLLWLGKCWNPRLRRFELNRSDRDGAAVPPIPANILSMADRIFQHAAVMHNKRSQFSKRLESPQWSACSLSILPPSFQGPLLPFDAIDANGCCQLMIVLGDSMTLQHHAQQPKDNGALTVYSGDAVVLPTSDQLAVSSIQPRTKSNLRLREGCLVISLFSETK